MIMENPIKMDDFFGYPLFLATSMYWLYWLYFFRNGALQDMGVLMAKWLRSQILLICSRRSKTSSRNSLPGNPISKFCWMKKMSVSHGKKTGMFWKRNWLGSGSMVRCLQNKHMTSVRCVSAFVFCSGWMLVVFTRSNTFYVYLEAEVGSGNTFWSDAISAKYLSPEKLGHNCLSSFSSSLLLVFPFYVFPVFITSSSLSLLIACKQCWTFIGSRLILDLMDHGGRNSINQWPNLC